MTRPLIEGHGLCKSYRGGLCALVDVDLTLQSGSFTMLTGPSGSGKTTLISLLSTLDRPTSGVVIIDGQDITRYSDSALSRIRRRMGIVTQDFALIAGLPIWENVTYSLIPKGILGNDRKKAAAQALDRLGLLTRMSARARELSGGELQRVAIARAIVGEPEILFADEPTSNLDDEASQQVIGIFAAINRSGTTIVVSSHDPRLAGHASKIVELRHGRLKSATKELAPTDQ